MQHALAQITPAADLFASAFSFSVPDIEDHVRLILDHPEPREAALVLMGHFGEIGRQKVGDRFSVVTLREPVRRLWSLRRHQRRDPTAFAVADARLSSCAYLSPDPAALFEGRCDLEASLNALRSYDLVLTERTLVAGLRLLLATLGGELSVPHRNLGGALPMPDGMAEEARKVWPHDFSLFNEAERLSDEQLAAWSDDPAGALHHWRGRLELSVAPFKLDWSHPPACEGWTAVVRTPLLAGPCRVLRGPGALELPLPAGDYTAVCRVWCAPASTLERLRVNDAAPVVERDQDPHLATLRWPVRVDRGPARLRFDFPDIDHPIEFWLGELDVG